jgi:hypothetical protein
MFQPPTACPAIFSPVIANSAKRRKRGFRISSASRGNPGPTRWSGKAEKAIDKDQIAEIITISEHDFKIHGITGSLTTSHGISPGRDL